METRILAKEVSFWTGMVESIGIPEMESLWHEHKGIAQYLNGQIRLLIKKIKSGQVSLANFNISDATKLASLLNCEHLDSELIEQLSHLLYGGDERKHYFSQTHQSGSQLSTPKTHQFTTDEFFLYKNLLFLLFWNIIVLSY